MKQELIDQIKGVGHWRINIRPIGNPERLLSLGDCRDLVERNSVSLRGWDYPHVSKRKDQHGAIENAGEFVQGWCDWYHHVEFWRMYKSSQFLHYKALREDLQTDVPDKPIEPCIAVGSSIYTMTELVEFASRLFRSGLYQQGAIIHVTIGNAAGRQLWIEDPMRMPFTYPHETQANAIEIERELSPSDLELEPMGVSASMLVELFDHFDWRVTVDRMQEDQRRFYQRRS